MRKAKGVNLEEKSGAGVLQALQCCFQRCSGNSCNNASPLDPSSVWRRGGPIPWATDGSQYHPGLWPGEVTQVKAWWQPGGIAMVVTHGGLRDPDSTFQLNPMQKNNTQIIMYLNFRHIKRCQVTGVESLRLLSVDTMQINNPSGVLLLPLVQIDISEVQLDWCCTMTIKLPSFFKGCIISSNLMCCCQCRYISNIDDSSMFVVEKMSQMDELMDMAIIAQWNNMIYKIPFWKYFCFMEQRLKSWMSLEV